jgi:hypothetical protein
MKPLNSLKPQIEILEKIELWETKTEFNRFLLIAVFVGFISIIAGWMEFISFRINGTNLVFFQFGFLDNTFSDEPVLFFSIWLITIIPILIIIVFSSGSSGFITWNKAYRIIGIIAIFLYFSAELSSLLLGKSNSELIPIVWGLFLFLGFIIAGELLYRLENQSELRVGLFLTGILALLLGVIAIFLEQKLAMFFLLTSLGIILTIFSSLTYFIAGQIKNE